jgi:hypothetical protein
MAEKKTRKRAYIPPSSEVVNRKAHTTSSARSRPAGRSGGAGANNPRSANYVYPTPSLKRTLKRLPIYFLLIFALQVWLLGNDKKDISTSDRVLFAAAQAANVTIVFAPFMHWMDKLSYNRWLKRTGGTAR